MQCLLVEGGPLSHWISCNVSCSKLVKLCGHPHIGVERELNLNVIVVCGRDAKMPVSFVTPCDVSVPFSTVLRFSFSRSGLVQTTVIF